MRPEAIHLIHYINAVYSKYMHNAKEVSGFIVIHIRLEKKKCLFLDNYEFIEFKGSGSSLIQNCSINIRNVDRDGEPCLTRQRNF